MPCMRARQDEFRLCLYEFDAGQRRKSAQTGAANRKRRERWSSSRNQTLPRSAKDLPGRHQEHVSHPEMAPHDS